MTHQHDPENQAVLREYRAIIWIGDEPGKRISMVATSLKEAKALLIEEFGEGHVYTLWNEADRNRSRGIQP